MEKLTPLATTLSPRYFQLQDSSFHLKPPNLGSIVEDLVNQGEFLLQQGSSSLQSNAIAPDISNFSVFVRLISGGTLCIHVKVINFVCTLIDIIQYQTWIPSISMKLLHGGRQLWEGNSLRYYDKAKNSLILLVSRLNRGSKGCNVFFLSVTIL